MSFIVSPRPQRSPLGYQIPLIIMIGILVFFSVLALITGGFRFIFANRILPGITIAGVDLSNLTPMQAVSDLNERITFPSEGRIVFRRRVALCQQ